MRGLTARSTSSTLTRVCNCGRPPVCGVGQHGEMWGLGPISTASMTSASTPTRYGVRAVLWALFCPRRRLSCPHAHTHMAMQVEALFQRIDTLQIDMKDVDEKFIRGSGAGGQKINKTSNNVQLIHLRKIMRAAVVGSQPFHVHRTAHFLHTRTYIHTHTHSNRHPGELSTGEDARKKPIPSAA